MLLLRVSSLYAEDGLNASAGMKFIYAKDENVLQEYYKPFAVIGWSDEFFDINASYYRWMSYSVTDELLNTKEVDINQPELEVSVYPLDLLSIDLGYSFYSGDSSYRAQRIAAGLMLDFETTSLSLDYSYKPTEYEFGVIIKNLSQNAAVELSMDITDSLSWDLGYDYEWTDYKTYGYTYGKHTARTGLLYIISLDCFLMGGLSGSADSSDVVSATLDAGITIKLFDHIKIGAIYVFTAEFSEITTSGSSGGGGSTTSSSIDTSITHTGSLSVSLYL